jgi:hypothetical protein
MEIDNKKILIGAGILVIGYLLYKKSVQLKEMKCISKYHQYREENSRLFELERYLSPEKQMNQQRQWMKINCN